MSRGFCTHAVVGLITLLALLLASTVAAQAIVVNVSQSGTYGVAMVPGTDASLPGVGAQPVTSTDANSQGCDPALSPDLTLLASAGLCDQGGSVMHDSETFALTWDPTRSYPEGARDYLEQYLKDVADASGTLTSPYAVATQYSGSYTNAAGQPATGRANSSALYGGACIDYGDPGGYTCQFGDTTGVGEGLQYPPDGCTASTASVTGALPITDCLTDTQLQSELEMDLTSTALTSHVEAGYTPLLVLLTPANVEVCLNAAGTLCSANASSTAQFCSYHGVVDGVGYVVQPWTYGTKCDEPNLPTPSSTTTPSQQAAEQAAALVSPLSASQLAAFVNPTLNGWVAENGDEIDDNDGCVPEGTSADAATLGTSGQNPYYLQPEFSNAGVIDDDPEVPACANSVTLLPTFVVPSSVDPGDVVQFDGSTTDSSLIVPNDDYEWSFGDGTTAIGASAGHSYAAPGTYTVKLTVTDRGGNVATASQTYTVTGATSTSAPSSTASSSTSSTSSTASASTSSAAKGSTGSATTVASEKLAVRLQLLPQSLKSVCTSGLSLDVLSTQAADGIASVWIPRAAAREARMKLGKGTGPVRIGVGTFDAVKAGFVSLTLHLSHSVVTHLERLRSVRISVRLTLVGTTGDHMVIDVAGRY